MTKHPQNPNRKPKLLGKILSGFLGAVVILLLGLEVVSFISARSNYGVGSVFGYQSLVVLTDSMEPTLPVGDGVVVKKVDINTLKASTAVENHDGDIITFYREVDGLIVTHRIIEIVDDDQDGTIDYIKTLGDNLQAQTCPTEGCTIANADYVYPADILGKVIAVSPLIGDIHTFFSSPVVTLFLVLIPLGLIFAGSVKDFIAAAKMKEEPAGTLAGGAIIDPDDEDKFAEIKQREKIALLKEIEKEKLRKEMLESNQGGTSDDGKKDE